MAWDIALLHLRLSEIRLEDADAVFASLTNFIYHGLFTDSTAYGTNKGEFMVALKTLIFSIVVPGTVSFVIPWLLLQQPWGLVFLFPSVWLVGFLPLLLGVGLYLWCAGAFTFIGKGTPAPIDAPKFLV